jgi:hypothetical protein
MKKFYLVFSFLFISVTIYSQKQLIVANDTPPIQVAHTFGDFSISGSANMLINTPNGVQFAGGIKIRTFVSKKISFDSDMVFGRDYIHGGPGIIGIPLWVLFWRTDAETNSDDLPLQDMLLKVAIILLSAEHVAYHIPVNKTMDVSPFVSLLRYKASYKYGDYSNVDFAGDQLSFTLGVELNHYMNRFVFSPYAEVNIGYTDHIPGFNLGVNCGYYFPVR